jgi:hypothetical protein
MSTEVVGYDEEVAKANLLEFGSVREWDASVAEAFTTLQISRKVKLHVCPVCSAPVVSPQHHWGEHTRIMNAITFLGGNG